MSAWRYRHDRAPIPPGLAETLQALLREKLADVLAADQQIRMLLDSLAAIRRSSGTLRAGRRLSGEREELVLK